MEMAAVKINNKIELYAEIFSTTEGEPSFTAGSLEFKEITEMYKQDKVGDGFCTLTLEQAQKLYIDLGNRIKEF